MEHRGVVALLLASTVPLFVLLTFLSPHLSELPHDPATLDAWKELMLAIIGGLVGYVAGRKGGCGPHD